MIELNGVNILDTIEELVDPKYSAVLVVDMQNEIAHEKGGYAKRGTDISGVRAIIPRISRILEDARRIGVLVTYAEFIHRNSLGRTLISGPSQWVHRKKEWISDVVEDTWESRTVDELAPHEGEIVIRKSRSSAIYNTYLDDIFKENSIRSVLLTGAVTGGCILKTAVDLMQRDYYAIIVRDCVADFLYPPKEILAWMERQFPMFTSDEIEATWARLKK